MIVERTKHLIFISSALCLAMPTGAIAQQRQRPMGPLETIISGMKSPQQQPPPATDNAPPSARRYIAPPSYEGPVPLQRNETFARFANGCGFIVKDPLAEANKEYLTTFNWFGGCRFGLAHGNGILQQPSGGPAPKQRYQYGYNLGATGTDDRLPYYSKMMNWVVLKAEFEDGRQEQLKTQPSNDNVDSFTAGDQVLLALSQPGMTIYDQFLVLALTCSDQGNVDWQDVQISAAESPPADAACKRYWALRGGARKRGVIESVSLDLPYIAHEHWFYEVGEPSSPKETKARYCSGGYRSADCTRVLQEMLAPYRARMQAVIDGQRRQYVQGLPWLAARFAPLEATLRKQIANFVARQARPAKLVPTPVARPVLQKGVRK